MHKWYVIQVISSQEKRVKKLLEDNRHAHGMEGFLEEILIPTENVAEVKKGEQKVSEKRLWPGYILAKLDLSDEVWLYVKNTQGVLDFLGGEKPTPISDSEISGILEEVEEKKKGVVQKYKTAVGDKVKITDGVFVNFIGTVTDVFHEKGRLSVTVSIFGRETRVDDLEFWQVEPAPQETEAM